MDKPKVAIKHAITPEQASHRSGYVESWITKHAGLGHFICQQSSGKGGHWKIDRESFDAFVRQHQAAGPNHHPHHKARARVPQAKQKATTRRDEKYSIAERKGLALLVNGQAIALFDSGQRPLFERIVKLLALAEGM